MYTNQTTPGTDYMMAELPHHERPRERLLKHGPDVLQDAELVAILLRSGRRGRSVLSLARDVLNRFDGNIAALASASVSELCSLPGIGQAKAVELRAAFSLAKRLQQSIGPERARIDSPANVADALREIFRGKQQEEFHVLLLDTKNYILKDLCVTIGLLDRSQVHAREVFRQAIRENCSRVVLVHNHPSGDPTPSAQDISCTRNLVSAGNIVGIEVLDHVILGKRTEERPCDFLSFKEQNLL
mgnify:CR=1 FL=1